MSPLLETRVTREKSGASKTLMCTTSPAAMGPSERPPMDPMDAAEELEPPPPEPSARGMRAGRAVCADAKIDVNTRKEAVARVSLLKSIVLLVVPKPMLD